MNKHDVSNKQIKLQAKQNILICLTYILGKAGFLSNTNLNNAQLLFEPISDISDKVQVDLRKQHYNLLTKKALDINEFKSKEEFYNALIDTSNNLLLEVANREIVFFPMSKLCSIGGFEFMEFLIKHGYKCKKVIYGKQQVNYTKFSLGNLKEVTLNDKFETVNYLVNKLKPFMGDVTNFTTIASVLLSDNIVDWLCNENEKDSAHSNLEFI